MSGAQKTNAMRHALCAMRSPGEGGAKSTMRAFIAIELPPAVRTELADLQQRLQRTGLKARWVRPENIHLTLKFLGEIDPQNAAQISAAVKRAAEKHIPFTLTVSGIGVFPHIRKARVMWAGLSGGVTELINLHKDLDAALVACGLEPEKRSFRGHLTLARFRDRVNPDKLETALKDSGRARMGHWTVADLVLFQSDLRPAGPIYSRLAAHPLGQ